jgi:energy-coupling factor transport system permease protein
MEQFEFMRNVTIGQFIPGDSIIHRLDPRAKILGYLFLLIGITFCTHWVGLVSALAFIFLLLGFSRVPILHALRGLLPPLPFLLILAVLQVFFNSTSPDSHVVLQFWIVKITSADILAGVMLLARFAGLVLALSQASFTLSINELIYGLTHLLKPLEKLHLPVSDGIMMIQVTLRFLPLLARTTEQIAKAQASRGADWDVRTFSLFKRVRQVAPVLVPMFLTTLQRAEKMALAMDARGYGAVDQRTSSVQLHFKLKDGLFVTLLLGVAALVLFI